MRVLNFLTHFYLQKPVALLALIVGATGVLIAILAPLAIICQWPTWLRLTPCRSEGWSAPCC